MNIAQLWAELENDQAWRQGEIRFFHNQSAKLESETEQNQFRRPLILLLYAHFEGFCKFALSLYVKTINDEGIKCSDADYAIAAASLADLFRALRNPEKKCDDFRRTLPNDTELHRFARDREFIERISLFDKRTVNIPDHVVDTESNLKPVVLRKNLYRLGFPHDQFEDIEGKIHLLLKYRNKIAHGELLTGIDRKQYERLKDVTYKVIDRIKRDVMHSLLNKQYLRAT